MGGWNHKVMVQEEHNPLLLTLTDADRLLGSCLLAKWFRYCFISVLKDVDFQASWSF